MRYPYHSSFISIKLLQEILMGHPLWGAKYRWSVKMSRYIFLSISRYISQTIQDSTIVTMEGE